MYLKNKLLLAIIKIYLLVTLVFKENDLYLGPVFKAKLCAVILSAFRWCLILAS